jgi:hypothetical protein
MDSLPGILISTPIRKKEDRVTSCPFQSSSGRVSPSVAKSIHGVLNDSHMTFESIESASLPSHFEGGVYTINLVVSSTSFLTGLRVMNDTIGSCRNKKITGICFFSESKDVDGVIEAKICLETSQEVLKEIARVLSFHKEVVSVKFQNEGDKVCGSSRNEHFYDDFCLHLPPHVTAEDPPSGGINRMISDTTARTLSDEKGERSDYGSQGSPGSPHQFRKLSTLQLNENKFVFMVENTETEEDYVMKEVR